MDQYTAYDALGLAALIAKKEVTAEEVLEAALMRAERAQDTLNCFSAIFPDIARQQIEGGLVFGLGIALGNAVRYRAGLPTSFTYDALGLPTLADC
ncbi:MAG: xanthine dehydrogenase family protein molybdopterin-binding subunit, partial [Pseudomonadota bacterium]